MSATNSFTDKAVIEHDEHRKVFNAADGAEAHSIDRELEKKTMYASSRSTRERSCTDLYCSHRRRTVDRRLLIILGESNDGLGRSWSTAVLATPLQEDTQLTRSILQVLSMPSRSSIVPTCRSRPTSQCRFGGFIDLALTYCFVYSSVARVAGMAVDLKLTVGERYR